MGLKVKDLMKFLEATDPECDVSLEIVARHAFKSTEYFSAKVDDIEDAELGSIKLIGYDEQ